MNNPDLSQGIFQSWYDNFQDMQDFTKRNYDIISIITIIEKNNSYECIYYAVKEDL